MPFVCSACVVTYRRLGVFGDVRRGLETAETGIGTAVYAAPVNVRGTGRTIGSGGRILSPRPAPRSLLSGPSHGKTGSAHCGAWHGAGRRVPIFRAAPRKAIGPGRRCAQPARRDRRNFRGRQRRADGRVYEGSEARAVHGSCGSARNS